jgi:prepilin-type N-terminal cleavage/methylation domain-containing protein
MTRSLGPTPPSVGRAGLTLVELALALALIGILAGIAVPRLRDALDRVQVRGAVNDIRTAFAVARLSAIERGRRTTLEVDSEMGTIRVRAGSDTLVARQLATGFGVRLSATRLSMVYLPTGLAFGAANLSIEVRRGDAVDTVVVSRLGRVRS